MRKIYYHLLVGLVLAGIFTLCNPLKAQTFDPDYLDGSIYLKLVDTTTLNLDPYPNNIPALNLILTTFGVDSLYRPFRSGHPALQNIYRLEFSNILGTATLLSQLELLPFVDYAEKIPLMVTVGNSATLPNDLLPSQWALAKIEAELAWGITLGSSSVKVAVIDNAIRSTHEDLNAVIWTNPNEIPNNFFDDDLNGYPDDAHGYDVADFDSNVNPPAGMTGWDHGSHCSGVAGAATNNGVGIASIGYGISIIPVKGANNAAGGNTLAKAYEGIDYARAAGADIISMSWGSAGQAATGDLILSLASNQGILLVAAAGNNGDSIPFYPAANPLCLAVGSTDQSDVRSSFSNYGSYVDVMAPGSDIYSCFAGNDSEYGTFSGTSMACPLTAGLAGLILSAAPTMTAAQVRSMIVNGCVNIDALNPGYAGKLGAGRINAWNSLFLTSMDPQLLDDAHVVAYPNPVVDQVNLHFPNSWGHETVSATLFNVTGTVLRSIALQPADDARIDAEGLASGLYFLKLSQGDRVQTLHLRIH